MRLLHISDIHFQSPQCLDPAHDEDRPVRTRLRQDAVARVEASGGVDAILVGGDIAFKGSTDEYEVAGKWLDELAAACGCKSSQVYVVPGNHDVDRAVCTTMAVRNVHRQLLGLSGRARVDELRRQLGDERTGTALFEPIAAYNAFATRYGCQVSANRLVWSDDLCMPGGIRLRLRGLTSTLLSGAEGRDDGRNLFLGPRQTAIDPEADVIDLVMCHHPLDWLEDGDDVGDILRSRAPIQIFGHKHRSRVDRDAQFIRFNAGAVNPDRREGGWRPCYNLIEVTVEGSGRERAIVVEAQVLDWQESPECFTEVVDEQRNPRWRHRISWPGGRANSGLPAPGPQVLAVDTGTATEQNGGAFGLVPGGVAVHQLAVPRDLVFRFWTRLTVSQRSTIVSEFGLLEERELSLPEYRRYEQIWRRARERNVIAALAERVEQAGGVIDGGQ
jgi:predicted phosphodiesterase